MNRNVLIISILMVSLMCIISIVAAVILIIKKNNAPTTTPPPSTTPAATRNRNRGDTILPNQSMIPGDYLQSLNGIFTVGFGGSIGRLLSKDGAVIPGAKDFGANCIGSRLFMNEDGNLIITDNSNNNCWTATNNPEMPSKTVLQDDGNLVLINTSKDNYIWSVSDVTYKGNTLKIGEYLNLGEYLENKIGNATAMLGGSKNRLVLSIFAPGIDGGFNGVELDSSAGFMMVVQSDGNLVILNRMKTPCWAAAKNAPNKSFDPDDNNTRVVLQDDGNLVAFDSNGNSWWSAVTGLINAF